MRKKNLFRPVLSKERQGQVTIVNEVDALPVERLNGAPRSSCGMD